MTMSSLSPSVAHRAPTEPESQQSSATRTRVHSAPQAAGAPVTAQHRYPRARLVPWTVALVVVFVSSLLLGRYDLRLLLDGADAAVGHERWLRFGDLVLHARLPRSLAAAVVGACLSIAGASFQSIFRNPLVSPDMLGASAGSAFGAALAIVLGFGIFGVQALAFGSGIVAVLAAGLVSSSLGTGKGPLQLILSGLLVSAVFTSLLSLVKFLADPYSKLPDITFWLLGSLSAVNLREALLLAGCSVLGIVPLLFLRWKLNLLSLTEEEARSLGVNTQHLRIVVVAAATLITSAAVAVCGLIGWVGLIVPHTCRLLFGPNNATLLGGCVVMGALYLLGVDTAARCALPLEVPLGIPIALLGAPYFAMLLRRSDLGWA